MKAYSYTQIRTVKTLTLGVMESQLTKVNSSGREISNSWDLVPKKVPTHKNILKEPVFLPCGKVTAEKNFIEKFMPGLKNILKIFSSITHPTVVETRELKTVVEIEFSNFSTFYPKNPIFLKKLPFEIENGKPRSFVSSSSTFQLEKECYYQTVHSNVFPVLPITATHNLDFLRMLFAQKQHNERLSKNINFLSLWEKVNQKKKVELLDFFVKHLHFIDKKIEDLPLLIQFIYVRFIQGDNPFINTSARL